MLSGMKLPEARVKELISEAHSEASQMSGKVRERIDQVITIDIPKDSELISASDLRGETAKSINSNLMNRRR
jgi:hypothetical protein